MPGNSNFGPPGVLGIWGEWLFIFRELGSTGYYLRRAREQSHNFGDKGSLAKKQKKKKEKRPFCLISVSGGLAPRPHVNSKCICVRSNMLIKIDLREKYDN